LPLPQLHSNRTRLTRSEAVARIADRTLTAGYLGQVISDCSKRIGVTSLTVHGHVTSSVMWFP